MLTHSADLRAAMRQLDTYYSSADGLQRPNGLSLQGRPDFTGIAAWIFDVFLKSRHAGLSYDDSWRNVVAAIERTDEWQTKHPGVAPSEPIAFDSTLPLERAELVEAMHLLDGFYTADAGLQRNFGLSIGGRPDFEGIAAWMFHYLERRLAGDSVRDAWFETIQAIERSDEWTAKHPPVETSTLLGKHLMGYQGWFQTPGDEWGAWGHWFRGDSHADQATFDLWPDIRECRAQELHPTKMSLASGQPAQLFSSLNPSTVDRHFRWMREYNIDGVSLGRFTAGTKGDALPRLNRLLHNVRAAAERHHRTFFVWYDITGNDPATLVDDVIGDWVRLVDQQGLTESPSYLHHRGKPLLGVWGMGAGGRPGTPAEWQQIIDTLKNHPIPRYRTTLLAGATQDWRVNPTWTDLFRSVDVISPWAVGAFNDDAGADNYQTRVTVPDLELTTQLGIDYLPVAHPGFSWANLARRPGDRNSTPRRGGRFYWRQVHNILSAGANTLFTAMFDEVDEGTAMFKMMPTQAQLPTEGWFLTLDVDGDAVSSDWYLRLGGAATDMLRRTSPLSSTIPIVTEEPFLHE